MNTRTLIWLSLLFFPVAATAELDYFLNATLDPAAGELSGEVRLRVSEEQVLTLDMRDLRLIQLNGQPPAAPHASLSLHLRAGEEQTLRYQARFPQSGDNAMSRDDVFLLGHWYPRPPGLARYHLQADLPAGFLANAAADRIIQEDQDGRSRFTFEFPYLSEGMSLTASKDFVRRSIEHRGVLIDSYFFTADAALADDYLQYSKTYLDLYTNLLTPYPYRRFAIVENRQPTGYALPTYTLLGQQVVRLPFIVKTSLGHEILHQWFGNSLFIDYAQGNWSEGLTQYLADHYYAEREGQGAAYRKQILVNYQAYVHGEEVPAVRDFRARHNKLQSAVGYGKVALLFHALRQRLGDGRFFGGLRELLQRHSFQTVSWAQISALFSEIGGEDLESWFSQWLDRRDLPALRFGEASVEVEQGRPTLRWDIEQSSAEPYQLRLPLSLYYPDGSQETRRLALSAAKQQFVLRLEQAPLRVVLDEQYDLPRRLLAEEVTPSLALLLGAPQPLVVAAQVPDWAEPLLQGLGLTEAERKAPEAVTFADLSQRSVLFLGAPPALLQRLLGAVELPDDGVALRVLNNPYRPQHVIVLLNAANPAEAQAVARRLSHYGKYSELHFVQGRAQVKTIHPARQGILLYQRPADRALSSQQAPSLSELLPKLAQQRVVLVGEQHDQFAHHLNQLQVIRALHQSGAPLAIGLEMFQRPFQQVLDDYVAGRIDEREMLRRTEYFQRWRYDYNLYKPILDYARAHQIPLLALNLDRELTRHTASDGIDGLDAAQRARLPAQIDLSQRHYREDLREVFGFHQQHGHGQPRREFAYFLQSQALWDETMAQTAAEFLKQHPQHKLVILAGNGHIRKGYGIPQRLQRRLGAPVLSIVQDDTVEPGIADYVLLTQSISGREAPKLGVMVEETDKGIAVQAVSPATPAERAGVQAKDRLLSLQGEAIKTLSDLKLALFYAPLDGDLTLTVQRGGKLEKLPLRFNGEIKKKH